MTFLEAWYRASMRGLPDDPEVWDAHTHTGFRDPDGVVGSAADLLGHLDDAGHRGAVIMTSMDPGGYEPANDRVLAEADASAGRLLPFVRIDPRTGDHALRELSRGIDRGFVGLKLHPRGESFSMDDPVVGDAIGVASEAGLPVLVHAGRGIPSLGEHVLRLLDANPSANIILAHAAISDLSRLAPEVDAHPGLFFDTAWWSTASLLRLFSEVPPSRILYASDTPYGRPLMAATLTARLLGAGGLDRAAIAGVFGGNLLSLLQGRRPLDVGDRPSASLVPRDPLFLSLYSDLHGAVGEVLQGCDPSQALSLARMTCTVPEGHPHARALASIAASIDLISAEARSGDLRRTVARPLIVAASAALTPGQPAPDPQAVQSSSLP